MNTHATASTSGESPQFADIVRVLEDDGRLIDAAQAPRVSGDDLTSLYRAMVSARALDAEVVKLAAARQISLHMSFAGDEAATLGSAFAMRPEDWVFPTHREVAGALWRGMSAAAYADQLFGNARDVAKGRQLPDHLTFRAGHHASASSPSGTHLTHAVGFGWGAKLRGDHLAVLVHFAASATSSAGFHNAMNFAGVFKTPTVFFCRQSHDELAPTEQLLDKGIAYAVPTVRCDGADLLAVIRVTRAAVARAASGEGATLIEAVTPRHRPDHPADPIRRVRRHLAATAGWTDAADEALRVSAREEAVAALAEASAAAAPALSTLFDDVYSEPSARLVDQRRELEATPRFGAKD